jgi:hypothetical protein
VADDGSGNIQITTSTAHGWSTNQEVFASDIGGVPEANGRFFVTVLDAVNVTLRGPQFNPESAYTSGGTLTTSSDRFEEVHFVEELSDRAPEPQLREYSWSEDMFQFIGATQDVQLRIRYLFNNSAPTAGSLVYEGIENALAHRASAILAYAHNRGQGEAGRLDVEARGPQLDGGGGLYYLYLSQKVREMQKEPLQRPVRPPAHLADIYFNHY